MRGEERSIKKDCARHFGLGGGLIWIDIKYRADVQPQRYSDNIKGEPYLCQKITTGTKYSTHARLLDAFKKPHLRATSWFPGC